MTCGRHRCEGRCAVAECAAVAAHVAGLVFLLGAVGGWSSDVPSWPMVGLAVANVFCAVVVVACYVANHDRVCSVSPVRVLALTIFWPVLGLALALTIFWPMLGLALVARGRPGRPAAPSEIPRATARERTRR